MNENLSKDQDLDEKVNEYFENKYFKNEKMNRKFPEGVESTFEFTANVIILRPYFYDLQGTLKKCSIAKERI